MNDKVQDNKGMAAAVDTITRKVEITLSEGKKVEVRLCKVKDIAVFLKFTATVFTDLGIEGGLSNAAKMEEAVRVKLDDGAFILKLISERSADVFEIVAKFTNLSLEEINELDLDDAVAVVKKVVEVNYSFFTQRVLPMLRAALAGHAPQTKGTAAK